MPAGRPPKFSDAQKEQIIDDVCLGLSGSDSSLSEVLIDLDSIICERTFYEWCSSNPKFAQKSARAREMQGFYLADKALVESRTCRLGQTSKQTPKGEELTVGDNVERSKLIVQTYFKRAGQLNKALRDKADVELSGEVALKRVIADI